MDERLIVRMAEAKTGIQCTDPNEHGGTDILAPIAGQLDHRVNPEEVCLLYDDATELVQKNKVKDRYIEELEQKIQQLEQKVQDSEQDRSAMRRQLVCMEESYRTTSVVTRGGGRTGFVVSGDQTDRDLIQRLLLKLSNLENENKELREMYRCKVADEENHERLARQCLQQEEKIQQLQHKEAECKAAQKQIKELQFQLKVLKDNAEGFRSSPEGFPDAPQTAPQTALIQEVSSSLQESSSIRLQGQTSPPLKRGRFTMEKSCPYECSKCSAFFSTKEEAAKTACCYHPKEPVPAILRHGSGNIDPVSPPDIFWPCCQQIGRQAIKCARGSTHKFIMFDGGKNPER